MTDSICAHGQSSAQTCPHGKNARVTSPMTHAWPIGLPPPLGGGAGHAGYQLAGSLQTRPFTLRRAGCPLSTRHHVLEWNGGVLTARRLSRSWSTSGRRPPPIRGGSKETLRRLDLLLLVVHSDRP
eukprot:CAMPEP_0171062868 /NCGR_PEP_ID=MMETSP0766_2-20121228/5296_1 /TAXON_ID=439317 /ORGANISM="Gambierdiscus australes, Strain CAWD 149" /LENGTH=125 /DNA_ID=CAMNT_0011518689 /DNA_START=17 /DNA_END=394 /DNA_ORIENTATION=-